MVVQHEHNGSQSVDTVALQVQQPTTLSFVVLNTNELVAYEFAGEEHFSTEFIQSLASPFQHSVVAIFLPLIIAPLSLLLVYEIASSPSLQLNMAGSFSFLKAIFLPALIALILYTLLTLLLIPLYRRHRARYSQYLPLQTPISSLSSSTATLRSRISDALFTFLVPSSWAARRNRSRVVDARDDDEELGGGTPGTLHRFDTFDESDGEDMDFDEAREREHEIARGRRDGLSLSMDARTRGRGVSGGVGQLGNISDRRLSRELEEGFRDDSDDDDEDGQDRTGPRTRPQ